MNPKEIRKFSIEPGSIANLDCKLMGRGEFSKEWDQAVEKFVLVSKRASTEERELKEDRT